MSKSVAYIDRSSCQIFLINVMFLLEFIWYFSSAAFLEKWLWQRHKTWNLKSVKTLTSFLDGIAYIVFSSSSFIKAASWEIWSYWHTLYGVSCSLYLSIRIASLAQGLEHWSSKPGVRSSNLREFKSPMRLISRKPLWMRVSLIIDRDIWLYLYIFYLLTTIYLHF